jgi:hypothetical protein
MEKEQDREKKANRTNVISHTHTHTHTHTTIGIAVANERYCILLFVLLISLCLGRINSQYGNLEWTPIIYLYQSLNFEELIALYYCADVGLIIPLRDGMNLVAKVITRRSHIVKNCEYSFESLVYHF